MIFYAFGFERICVVLADLYFVDPAPLVGQEGAERGVRVEVRLLAPGELKGSIYSARPITVDRPVWRVDLLEAVASTPGSLDRAHHHPRFSGWDPGPRQFVDALSAQPLDWVATRLSDLDALLAQAGVPVAEVGARDAMELRQAVPEIIDVLRRLLDRVKTGELPSAPPDQDLPSIRSGWL